MQCSDKIRFPQLRIKCSVAKSCPGTHTVLQAPMILNSNYVLLSEMHVTVCEYGQCLLYPLHPLSACETEQSYKETCMICNHMVLCTLLILFLIRQKTPLTACYKPTYPIQRHSSHHAFQMWHTSRMVSVVGAYVIQINIYKLIIISVH